MAQFWSLLNAVNFRDHEAVSRILREGQQAPDTLNVNQQHPEYRTTALHMACLAYHVGICALLLAYPGIDVNVKTWLGVTPLTIACTVDHYDMARMLIETPGIDLQQKDRDGATAVWTCARISSPTILRLLLADERLAYDPSPVYYEDVQREVSPIEVAKCNMNHQCIALLQKFEVDPASTRFWLRLELSRSEECAAVVFSLVVLL